jgi:hypothetical protein
MMQMTAGKTYWNILHDTVSTVVGLRENQIKFGAKWFNTDQNPSFLPDQCRVDDGLEVEPALGNAGLIGTTLPPANASISTSCLTPAQDGYDRATDWVLANVPTETTAMVLFMDGAISDGRAPNTAEDCNDATNTFLQPPFDDNENANTVAGLTGLITSNAALGIKTYVVGFDTDAALNAEMNGYAQAGQTSSGGTDDFFFATDAAGLDTAFDSIAVQVATCDISVAIAPPYPNLVDVEVGGVEYPQISDTECASPPGPTNGGWYYLDPGTNQNLRLCGTACDEFKDNFQDTGVIFNCIAG